MTTLLNFKVTPTDRNQSDRRSRYSTLSFFVRAIFLKKNPSNSETVMRGFMGKMGLTQRKTHKTLQHLN
jgi:hypothetical protein